MTKRVSGILFLLIAWEIVSIATNSPFMPRLGSISNKLILLIFQGGTLDDMVSSLVRLFAGLLLATGIGITIGVVSSISKFADFLLSTVVDIFRSTSGLAIYPLIILFLGFDDKAKIFLVFWGAFPAITINTIHGLITVDRQIKEAAQMDGAEGWTVLTKITFPLAVPTMITGIRIGAGIGWISLIASEMISGNTGLGYIILFRSQVFDYSGLFAGVFLVSSLGLITHALLLFVEETMQRRIYEAQN